VGESFRLVNTLYYLLPGVAVLGGVAYFLRWKFRVYERTQARLQRETVALQQEKKVIYEFLHDLGEAFTEDIDRDHLLRIIVTCARKVTSAQGAAIYLWTPEHDILRAAVVSGFFPPPIKIDNVVADQLAGRREDLEAFLRLESIPGQSQAVVARVAQSGTPVFAENAEMDERFPWFRQASLQTHSYLAVPLHYRAEQLGVLALANPADRPTFTSADFDLVKSVADQAAYSLQYAQIYQQLSEKKRLDHEIEVAREIQRVLLPATAPQIAGFNCAALNIPAQQVSGDYFDFIRVDDEHWGVAVADVSGKGVPASLVMTMCRSVLRSVAPGRMSPAEVLREVNRQLYPDIREDMFVTMLYLILDRSGTVTLARAGHETPLLWRAATRQIEVVESPGMALGIDPGDTFDEVIRDVTLALEPRDTLVAYTDGINEALDDEGNEFGQDQLGDVLQTAGPSGVDHLVTAIIERVQRFSSGHPQNDDITLAAVQRSD
jgi:sigma-B regulation protein RsbU (phosphoserine phosphatase)